MKKAFIIVGVIVIALVIFAFSGAETDIELKNGNTTEAGDSVNNGADGTGETAPVPTTIVEVTDNKGEVVETQSVTLSKEEVSVAIDYFSPADSQTTVPSGVMPERVTDSVTAESQNAQNDIAVLRSNRYYVVGRVEIDGEMQNYKTARDGAKYSAVANYNGTEMGIIVGDTHIYMVNINAKEYFEISKQLLIDEAGDDADIQKLLSGEAYDINKKAVKESTAKENGVTYNTVEYDDGSVDYLKGKALIKSVAKDGSVLYYDSVSTEVPASIFYPPAGYKKVDINGEVLSEVVETTLNAG